MTKPEQGHYFAFNLEGFSTHENLGTCIDRQIRHNRTCYAVMKVQAPIEATYSIARFVPSEFYPDSPFKPGEEVYFTPCAAPHAEVAEDYRGGCTDTTGWTMEQWREYANGMMADNEEAQKESV